MSINLLSKIQTTEDAASLIGEIEILLKSIYEEAGQGFELALKSKVRAWVSRELLAGFSKEGVDKKELLENLKHELESWNVLILGLAFEPTQDFLEKVHDFVSKSVGKKVLLEINFVPKLVGGITVVFGGKYANLSLRKVFETEFQKSRDAMLELVNQQVVSGN